MMRRALLSFVITAAACGSSKQTPDSRDRADATPVIDAAPMIDATPPMSSLVVGDGTTALTEWSFPSTPIGAHDGVTLFVTNTGSTKTNKLVVSFTGAAAGDFSLDALHSTCGAALAAGDQCAVAIVFTPSAAGARDAALHVTGVPIPLDFPIHGDGAPAATGFTADTSLLDFGTVELSQQADRTILLSNGGASTITLGSRTATAGFAVVGDNCPATLTSGGACTVHVRFAPTAAGVITGTFSAASSANTASVDLRGIGERRVTITHSGGGAGTVTSMPSGIDCGTTCSGLFVGAVTLTAAASGGGTFAGWSDLCGTQPVCAIPAGGNVALDARFEAAGAKSIAITFAGAAPGIVYVQDQSLKTLLTCTSSCTTVVAPGTQVTLYGFTPSTFSGWSGDCTSATNDCNLGTIVNDRSATATFDRDQYEVATLLPGQTIAGLAVAPDGDLLIATADGVEKRTITGTLVWSRAIAGGAQDLATDDAGDVFGLGADQIFALTPAGAPAWSHAITPLTQSTLSLQSRISASPDGTVIAVLVDSGARVFDGSGGPRFTATSITGASGVAVAPDGTVAIAAPSPSFVQQVAANRYDKTGTALATFDPLPGEYDVSIAYAPSGDLAADTTGFSKEYVSSTTPAGTTVFATSDATDTGGANTPAAVAADSASDVISLRDEGTRPIPGLQLQVFTPTGTLAWTHVKPYTSWPGIFDDGVVGDVLAAGGTKRIAVAGTYGYSQPWIQVYDLP